jgi:hypothetical protein
MARGTSGGRTSSRGRAGRPLRTRTARTRTAGARRGRGRGGSPGGLTTAQRNRLPDSAFAIPSRRAFPIPTKDQARRAGISEAQRQRTLRNAVARAAQPQTGGSVRTIGPKARGRASATGGRKAWGTTAKPVRRGRR